MEELINHKRKMQSFIHQNNKKYLYSCSFQKQGSGEEHASVYERNL